ncbi:hypothetical protein EYF80_051665 [Liparis tanakae]|uniref:Uncharacterized protein n=1 Tax=Liparis tanakae TaxID=230148 RepID=A0A4Z2FCR0_9TELE|nr:hypothetical protein EYF80_051665 [Liparis tanakae]
MRLLPSGVLVSTCFFRRFCNNTSGLSVHHAVELGGRGLGPGAARPKLSLGRVLALLLVLQHLRVLDDGGGELGLGAGDGQALPVDVLVDTVL